MTEYTRIEKRKRENLCEEDRESFFETLRGRLDRDLEKDEKRLVVRHQGLRRAKELNRGMIMMRRRV